LISAFVLSLPPALLIVGGLVAGTKAPERRGSKAQSAARLLIATGLVVWLYLAHRLTDTALAIGIGGWLLAATSLAFRGSQTERTMWSGLLPLSAALFLAGGLIPDYINISLPVGIARLAALDSSYVALIAAWANTASVQKLKRPGFGEELEFLPELWLLRRARHLGTGITFALLTGIGVGAAFSQPSVLLSVATPWAIAALLYAKFLPLTHRARAYGSTLLFIAVLALVIAFFWKGQ
jgi:hypothetical protein